VATVVRASEMLAAAKRSAQLGKKLCKMYKVPVAPIEGNTKDVVCVCGTVVRPKSRVLLSKTILHVPRSTLRPWSQVGSIAGWVHVVMWCAR
jgi:hypothetical protein